MRFSDLTVDFPGHTNRLYERLEELRRSGAEIADLVNGNVNDHGIVFPPGLLGAIMTEAEQPARIYKPDPRGQSVAREAISRYTGIRAGQIVLTPGTSVSYWYVFKLLCEPGDEILCPAPSYPLFEYIARLAGATIRTYRLDEDRRWKIDFGSIEAGVTARTRAIVLISPHNPTGMVADRAEVEELAAIAARHELPVVSDEVFREFVYDGAEVPRPMDSEAPLVFTLNGFSKMFALPGMKIGWMGVSGEPAHVDRCLRTLELISDTFLPVNEIAQFAVPGVFEKGGTFLAEYRDQLKERRDAALAVLGEAAGAPPCGGFYMTLPIARDIEEEDLALELLEEEHVLVHPGYFYDIDGRHLVLSFVPEPGGLRRFISGIAGRL